MLEKSKKLKFFKAVGRWSKNRIFYQGYFGGKLSQKRPFFDILDRRECSLDQISEVLKKSKKSKFFKEVSAWFLSKNRIFYQGCLFRN